MRYVIADQELISKKDNPITIFIEYNNNNIIKCKAILHTSSSVKTNHIINKIKGNNYIIIDPKDATPRKI